LGVVADGPGSSDLRAPGCAKPAGLANPWSSTTARGSMIIAAEMAARAPADGYTLFLGKS
jgi:hypothetical protein